MIRFLADENLDNRILRGLLRRQPNLDVVRVQDLEIAGATDDTVLAWAASSRRILLTHDRRTIPAYALERIRRDEPVAGVIVIPDRISIGSAIDDLLLLAEATTEQEWIDQIVQLPL